MRKEAVYETTVVPRENVCHEPAACRQVSQAGIINFIERKEMDSDEKIIVGFIASLLLLVILLIVSSQWRWRLNRRDMIQRDVEYINAGYVQKAVPTDFEIVWVKDANSR